MNKVDVQFRITGNDIPADHGYHLLSAVSGLVPEIHGDDQVGVHPISGRLIGDRRLAITENSRLTIRLDSERIEQILRLAGKSLEINGSTVRVGVPQTRSLVPSARVYSRLVVIKGFTEPEAFLEAAKRQADALEVRGTVSLVPQPQIAQSNRNATSGSRSPYLRRTICIRGKQIVGFALRVEDLTAEESIRIQEQGLGGRRRFGCGVFVSVGNWEHK